MYLLFLFYIIQNIFANWMRSMLRIVPSVIFLTQILRVALIPTSKSPFWLYIIKVKCMTQNQKTV